MAMHMNLRKCFTHLLKNQNKLAFSTTPQCASKKKKHKQVHTPIVVAARQLESVQQSLSSKGFLRSQKPYEAPENVSERVQAICSSLGFSKAADHKLDNMEDKFKLLSACFEDFKHAVPNSQVYEVETISDVIKFYSTSIDTTTPYEALKRADLPENLHIQYEYLRFHPDTDTKFNGKTAFPKSSTLVTGLKYRGKYEGHEAKRSWP